MGSPTSFREVWAAFSRPVGSARRWPLSEVPCGGSPVILQGCAALDRRRLAGAFRGRAWRGWPEADERWRNSCRDSSRTAPRFTFDAREGSGTPPPPPAPPRHGEGSQLVVYSQLLLECQPRRLHSRTPWLRTTPPPADASPPQERAKLQGQRGGASETCCVIPLLAGGSTNCP